MQFSVIQTRVAEETGLSVTDDSAKIKSWINEAYQQLSGFYNWPWLLTNFTMQTTPDIDTLTASVSAGGTSVTLSSVYATSLASDYMIQFTSVSDDWYTISAHTAGTAAVTLANSFNGSTNLTSGTCLIRKVYYSLPSGIDRIIDLRQTISDAKIEFVDPRSLDRIIPDPSATGDPLYASLVGMTSTGLWRLSFYPTPSIKMNLQGRGYTAITELSGDTEVPLIPAKFHSTLVFLALALFGHDYIDDDRVQSATRKAKDSIQQMIKESRPVPGQITVIQPWDCRGPRSGLGVRLPSNYPWPFGV